MNLKTIFENNRKWIGHKLQSDPEYFQRLSRGQSPEILYIGCSDSRVPPEQIMGLLPGDVFVHRNIANQVSNSDLNVMSVIHYALEHLGVKHVVVCGHYGCGGVTASFNPPTDSPAIAQWLAPIRNLCRTEVSSLDAIPEFQARVNRLAELNVHAQCVNLIKIPKVQTAYRRGDVSVHGWIFDIPTGRLTDLEIDLADAP